MKILVTGATGLLGAVLTRRLVEQGQTVRILRRPTSRLDLLGDVAGRVEHALGDVTDPESVGAAMDGITHVYHVAAFIGAGGRREAGRLHRINVEGTAHVVDAARAAGVVRLVHTSSIAALGRTPEDDILDETARWQESPLNSAYAVSKYRAELEVHRAIAEGLDAVMVNPSLIFGVGRPGENTRQIVDRVRQGRMPAVPAGGTCVVDVEDVAEGHLRAMAQGRTGARYVLGGENLTWHAIVTTLAAAFGVAPPRRTLPPSVALALGAAAEAVAWLTRTPPRFSRSLARSTARFHRYDNRRAVAELGCTFRPFRETAERLAAALSATP